MKTKLLVLALLLACGTVQVGGPKRCIFMQNDSKYQLEIRDRTRLIGRVGLHEARVFVLPSMGHTATLHAYSVPGDEGYWESPQFTPRSSEVWYWLIPHQRPTWDRIDALARGAQLWPKYYQKCEDLTDGN